MCTRASGEQSERGGGGVRRGYTGGRGGGVRGGNFLPNIPLTIPPATPHQPMKSSFGVMPPDTLVGAIPGTSFIGSNIPQYRTFAAIPPLYTLSLYLISIYIPESYTLRHPITQPFLAAMHPSAPPKKAQRGRHKQTPGCWTCRPAAKRTQCTGTGPTHCFWSSPIQRSTVPSRL